MLNRKFKPSIVLLVVAFGLSACSTTNFGGSSRATDIDDKLIIPPSLKVPAKSTNQAVATTRQTTQPAKTVSQSSENYYIIVGTYPDQLDALDTFTRISSIGLKGATMESRRTKAGNLLHMVRLGPYNEQENIDKAKDSLTNTGLSQFKIVKN